MSKKLMAAAQYDSTGQAFNLDEKIVLMQETPRNMHGMLSVGSIGSLLSVGSGSPMQKKSMLKKKLKDITGTTGGTVGVEAAGPKTARDNGSLRGDVALRKLVTSITSPLNYRSQAQMSKAKVSARGMNTAQATSR